MAISEPIGPVVPDATQASGSSDPAPDRHIHAVQFYDDDAFLATVVGEFLADGLRGGEPTVVIATAPHRAAFARKLEDYGIDVKAARRDGRLQLLDARRTLSKFMHGDTPDAERFNAVIGSVILDASRGRADAPVRAYGEMVDLLWKDGNTEGAIQLERLWNDLADQYHFALLCAYAMANFYRANDTDAFERICAEHSRVTPTESYAALDERSRLHEVSRLQQRARAYEAEVAQREVVERRLRDTVLALRAREAELREREADLRDVLENAAEGIHLVAADGTIEWANAAELEMLGYTAEEYIGRNISEFHVDGPVIQNILERLQCGETLRSAEARVRHKDGSVRYVMINSNVRWRDGQFLHTRCFTRDVTELRVAAEAREAALAAERTARAAAEQANRAKSDFLAVMSHELRTPLNAIGGYAELVELGIHGPVTPQQREVLDRIQRSQRMLLGLINQVLNYARIESGSVTYRSRELAIDEVLRATEALIAPQFSAKGLHFQPSPPCPGVHVHADEEKLQQIVLNLLTNAVKFTDRGGTIRVDVDPAGDVVQVRVSDTGIGIPPEKLESIFEPFVQVDTNYTRTREGVGLGLAISRDLARGMGGNLTAASVEGEGSTFTLSLSRA